MIVKFFARGSGGGKGVADYLMGKDRNREGASVLRGDIEQTKEIIDGLDFSRNYTAGVLSFEEKHTDLTREQKEKIMDRFEESIFSGLSPNQRDITWIEHTDKNERLELNFVIPNVELQSGKRLQPYYHKADKNRINNCKDLINHDFSLSDPNSPEKRRMLTTAKDLPGNKKEALEAINKAILARIKTREINDRKDVVSFLESAGFELARTTKQSISIKNPEGGQNLRLKGAFYEESFTASRELTADYGELAERHRQETTREIQRTREIYQRQLEQAEERNQRLYGGFSQRRERLSEQLQERAREEYNGIDFADRTYTADQGETGRTEMDDSYGGTDRTIPDISDSIRDISLHDEIRIREHDRLEAISRDLQKGVGRDNVLKLHDRRETDEGVRADRPEIQGQDVGRWKRSLQDTGRIDEKGGNNDRNGKTIAEYLRGLRSAIFERIDAFKERFRTQREANREFDDSLPTLQDENRRFIERVEGNISDSKRNISESNRLTTSVGKNNQTLDKMRIREQIKKTERIVDNGISWER